MDETKVSIKKNAVNYGLILGAILAISITLIYAVNIDLLTKWWLGITFFFIAMVVGIISVAKAKQILVGYISFKQAFTSYFITIAVGLFISVIVGILIFNVIDPEAADYLNERILEITRSMMASFGTPESEIDKVITEMEGKNNYAVFAQLKSYVFQLAFYSLFGLLIALIMKKTDPNKII